MIGLKAAAITGGVGVIAVLIVFTMLTFEKNAHATTKQSLADEKSLVADLRSQQATTAADRVKAIAEALAEQQEDLDRQLKNEERLRRELAKARTLRRTDQRAADANIVRLKRENQKLQLWADTLVPDDIVDWVHNPADEAAAPGGP